MAGRQVIVVKDAPPRLEKLDEESVRNFIREFSDYEEQQEDGEGRTPMKKCLAAGFLPMLLESSKATTRFRVVRTLPTGGPQRDQVRVELQTPIAPKKLVEVVEEDEVREAKKSSSTQEGRKLDFETEAKRSAVKMKEPELPIVLYLSNAHVEAMLIELFGPRSRSEAARLMQAIKMDETDFLLALQRPWRT